MSSQTLLTFKHRENDLQQLGQLFRASFVDIHWKFSHDTMISPTSYINSIFWVLVTERKSISFSRLHSCMSSETANPRIPHVIKQVDCTEKVQTGGLSR